MIKSNGFISNWTQGTVVNNSDYKIEIKYDREADKVTRLFKKNTLDIDVFESRSKSDFLWRESLEEGDLVDYNTLTHGWILYRIDDKFTVEDDEEVKSDQFK